MGKPKIVLTDFEDMLKFDEQPEAVPVRNGLLEMDLDRLEYFPDHRFKLYEGQRLTDMVESIKSHGILLPVILWHMDDERYVILSGHNRCNAAAMAGLTKAPVIIKEHLTMDEAVLIVTETNLHQRSIADMSHSERAYCLSQHYEALKSQGKRNDLLEEIEMLLKPDKIRDSETCAEVQHKLKSRDKMSSEYSLSRDKVAKYIRLSKLIDPLMERIDSGEISFLAGYDLAFIENQELQQMMVDFMVYDECKMDMKKAEILREYYESKKLNDKTMQQILCGENVKKPKSNKPQPFKVKPAVISKYFVAGESKKQIESTIEQALEFYFRNRATCQEQNNEMSGEDVSEIER